MTDGLVSMLPLISAYHYVLGLEPSPDTTIFNGQLTCYHIYRTRDDREIAFGALEEKFWQNFCRAIERDDLLNGDHHDVARQDELKQELTVIFATRDANQWQTLLDGRDTCCEVLKNMTEVHANPHFQERGMFWRLPLESGGDLLQTNCPVMVDEHKPTQHRAAPKLGQHTDQILNDLGYDQNSISDLRERGVI